MLRATLGSINAITTRCNGLSIMLGARNTSLNRRYSTQLEKILIQSIVSTGPLTVAQYMKSCLAHPTNGYYMKGDVFGVRGDFITSPEISQTFGELLATWLVSRWMSAGKPAQIRIVELGPGRGTLMDDVLRTFRTLKALSGTKIFVLLIETSEHLRKTQKAKLHLHRSGVKIDWFGSINDVPNDNMFTMVLAHELFDALPIHIIEKTEKGFVEVLVGLAHHPAVNSEKLSPLEQSTDTSNSVTRSPSSSLQFVKSRDISSGSQLLAASSPRFQQAPIGSRIEVSPESWKLARSIGELIRGPGGGAGLIVDYGGSRFFGTSFRAFRNHQLVSPFTEPGNSDLTANVDFAYLREAISSVSALSANGCGEVVRVLGPISQRDFLVKMGLEVRLNKLITMARDDRRKHIKEGAERLIDPLGMGSQYQVMGIVPSEGSETDVYPFAPLSQNLRT